MKRDAKQSAKPPTNANVIDLADRRAAKAEAATAAAAANREKRPTATWHSDLARWLLSQHQIHGVKFMPNEAAFLESMAFYWTRRLPTYKQTSWLEMLEARTIKLLRDRGIEPDKYPAPADPA